MQLLLVALVYNFISMTSLKFGAQTAIDATYNDEVKRFQVRQFVRGSELQVNLSKIIRRRSGNGYSEENHLIPLILLMGQWASSIPFVN